jgi:hypothetical protein
MKGFGGFAQGGTEDAIAFVFKGLVATGGRGGINAKSANTNLSHTICTMGLHAIGLGHGAKSNPYPQRVRNDIFQI